MFEKGMEKWKYSNYIIIWNYVNRKISQKLDMPVT